MEPSATCRTCDTCKSGKYNVSPQIFSEYISDPFQPALSRCHLCRLASEWRNVGKILQAPVRPSIQATRSTHVRGWCNGIHFHHLNGDCMFTDRIQMEPLSVAVHAVSNIAQMRANQSIAIFGCGPVGLLCMAVAKALGASLIIAVDIVPSRVEFAVSYAATEGFLPPPFEPGEAKMAYSQRAVGLLKQKFGVEDRGSKGLNFAIDASGAEVCVQMGIFLTKVGGTMVQMSARILPGIDKLDIEQLS